jgi:hypothetical protein
MPLWVRLSRFAVGLFLGCAVFPQQGSAGDRSVSSRVLSSSFGLLSEYYPAIPSQLTAVGRLLSWAFVPFSTRKDRRSTYHGLSPPATFRLQGLGTLLTVYSLRSRAGYLSHRQRSWDSPFGAFPSSLESPRVSAEAMAHLPFPPPLFPDAEASSRPDRSRFLGITPGESPSRDRWV